MTEKKPPIDWAEIESDYRTSSRSIREIASWYSISEGAIRKRAKRDGWERPVSAPSTQGVGCGVVANPMGSRTVPRVDEVIGRGRNLAERLLDELDAETMRNGELEAIIMMSEEDPARQAALKQAVSLPVRAKTLQTIALALKTMSETASAGGKKQQRQDAAENAAKPGGKFAPRSVPRLAVNNS